MIISKTHCTQDFGSSSRQYALMSNRLANDLIFDFPGIMIAPPAFLLAATLHPACTIESRYDRALSK
ncbi:hypothetical protein N9C84_03965 [Desulfobacterales bacterium]|nr:hypothetical protein [Desulfobacterales bacterium]